MLSLTMDNGFEDQSLDAYDDEEVTVRIGNPAAESGLIKDFTPGLSWLNSATIDADPNTDRVRMYCSIGDPRGAFSFEVRRLTDGRILIHLPHPDESLAHMKTKDIGNGTLELVHDNGEPIHFVNDPVYSLVFWYKSTKTGIVQVCEVWDEEITDTSYPIYAYIPLNAYSKAAAETKAEKYQEYIDRWEAEDETLDLDDIPEIEY